MLTAVLLIQIWRIAVVQPPVFRPNDITMMMSSEALYRAKVNQGRDLNR